jgi:hypothetical protein
MTDLRDARLKKALEHAPDEAGPPPALVREAIRAHAAKQARLPVAKPALAEPKLSFWRWLLRGGGARQGAAMPRNAALATVLVAGIVTLVVHFEETQGPPELRASAPVVKPPARPPLADKLASEDGRRADAAVQQAAQPRKEAPVAVAPGAAAPRPPVAQPVPQPFPELANKSMAGAPPVADVAGDAQVAAAPPKPLAAPEAREMAPAPIALPPPPAAPAARSEATSAPAKMRSAPPAVAHAGSGAFIAGELQRAAGTSDAIAQDRRVLAAPALGEVRPIYPLVEWQAVRVLQGGKAWQFSRGQAQDLAGLLTRLASRQAESAAPPSEPDYQLELLGNGGILATLSLTGDSLRGSSAMAGVKQMPLEASDPQQIMRLRALLDRLVQGRDPQ